MRNLTVGDDTVLLSAVKKHVMRQSQEPDPDRAADVLHPSDMSKNDWCWRSDYYRIIGADIDTQKLNPSFRMENVFAEGHEIHRKWQQWCWDLGYLYGVFRCRSCRREWWDLAPKMCFYCGRRDFLVYRELPLRADDLNIAGHSDGGLMIEDQPFRLLEIKSLSIATLRFEAPDLYERYLNNESLDKIWMDIQRPLPSHTRQGMLYLYLAARGANRDVPVPQEMVFIYEWKPAQDVKEFVVRYNPRMVERSLMGAEMVAAAIGLGRPPPRPPWAVDAQISTCRSCPYQKACWKLNEQWDEEAPAPIPVKRAAANVRRRAPAWKAG